MDYTEANNIEPNITEQDTKHLLYSTLLLQIGIAINVISKLVFAGISHLMLYLPIPETCIELLYVISLTPQVLELISYSLILIGVISIIYSFKSEIHLFCSISAIVLFVFLLLLKLDSLISYILISTGRGYMQSDWQAYGLATLPPLGILSCYLIGRRLNLHFSAFINQKRTIQWLAISFAIVWFLRIALAFILWLQNSHTIDFSIRWLVIYRHRWQLESIFYWRDIRYLTIALLIWQIWLFFCLRTIKLKCHHFSHKDK